VAEAAILSSLVAILSSLNLLICFFEHRVWFHFFGNAVPAKPPTLDDIPELVETMLNEKGEKSATATKCIYELCDVGHKQNRVPMVCSGNWDVLTPLAKCLTQESGNGLHLVCLALNNLSIPTENKRVMTLGPASKDVIGGLCKVIAEDKKESYLCCICLMNLSFLEAGSTTIMQHSPVAEGASHVPPLQNPDSLLRVLEKLFINSPPAPLFKWACHLINNLAKSEENAALIGKTEIPKYVVESDLANISQQAFVPFPSERDALLQDCPDAF
jgi:hypothetical protein